MVERNVSTGECIWLLGSLCNLYRIPFDAALVASQFPPPYTLATFHEAARALGFKTGIHPLPSDGWQKLPFPCIAFLKPPDQNETSHTETPGGDHQIIPFPSHPEKPSPQAEIIKEASAPSPSHTTPHGLQPVADRSPLVGTGEGWGEGETPILIVKSDGQQLLYFRPNSQVPETLTIAEASQLLEPDLILVAREQAGADGKPEDIAGFETEKPKFGFRWFIPELLKHKKIWRDVVLASLAIQLVGLATPVFTQVIIDKVVVHQTSSTLIVIGVALLMFMVFTMAMTWLRQYLVLHTGNRIDAVLGSQVFRHLLRLPLPYFEQRPTGVLVARLQGVETIREFVSSAAVTLVLDFPFLLIFIAVMFAYSWQLSLIAVFLLGIIGIMSFLVAPVFRDKLNKQFMLGARNQAYLTEYLSGMATVKSLQMEPHLETKCGDYLASYLAAGFSTKQTGNSYNVVANGVEQIMTLSILIVGALLVMQNDGFTVGMLVAFQMFAGRMSQPMLRLVGLWQEFQQADIAVKRLGENELIGEFQ